MMLVMTRKQWCNSAATNLMIIGRFCPSQRLRDMRARFEEAEQLDTLACLPKLVEAVALYKALQGADTQRNMRMYFQGCLMALKADCQAAGIAVTIDAENIDITGFDAPAAT